MAGIDIPTTAGYEAGGGCVDNQLKQNTECSGLLSPCVRVNRPKPSISNEASITRIIITYQRASFNFFFLESSIYAQVNFERRGCFYNVKC